MLFSNKGYIYKIPGFLLKNIMNGDIKLEVFTGELEKKEKIIRISSISSYDDNLALYSFSKKGLVKKTLLNEFKVDTQKQFFYKLKTEDDEVISVDINNITLGNLIIITKKGMAIRFPVENVNSMGKVASGVTGISLREEDEVIFGAYVSKYLDVNGNTVIISPRSQEISLISKANEKLNITVEDIKLQNRAGRGTNVILMIDDELKDVMIV